MDDFCEIRVYDKDFEWIGVILNAESVQLRREFYGVGSFEIHIRPDKRYVDALRRRGNFIVINKDGKKAGIVRDFYLQESRDGALLVVYGDTLDGFTKQRTVLPPTKAEAPGAFGWDRVSGKAETVLKHYMRRNLTQSTISGRNFPYLVIADDLQRGIEMPWQTRYEPLNQVLQDIAEFGDIGWAFYYIRESNSIIVDVVEGVDRTLNQRAVSPVIFKMEYTNMESYKYTEDYQKYKSTGILGGAGEDENRQIYTLGGEYQGIDRWEIFLDCGSPENINELIYYGQQKLNDYKAAKTIEADALPKVYVFERDFDLGDLVSVYISRLDLNFDTRITSVNEIWERPTGYRYEVRFGDQIPNIFTVLQTKQEVR